ncbi:MAG: NAD(P)-dependent oxidoreductase, partial [Marinilabiliales bacterium]
IVNTAAITSVDYAELHKAETWSVNVVGVENLVNTVLKRNIKLIHLSTDFVFDGMGPFYSEEDLTDPVSYYGYTKLEGEKRVEILQNACIIRTILVYGYYKDMVRSNFVLWVYNSLKQGNEIKVVDDQYRMPTYVNDLSEAIKTIAEKEKEGLYHISGNEYLSIFEFAKTIASMFNLDDNLIKPVSSFMLDQVGKRPPKTGFNLDKAASELNYLPTSIKEALTKMKQLMD